MPEKDVLCLNRCSWLCVLHSPGVMTYYLPAREHVTIAFFSFGVCVVNTYFGKLSRFIYKMLMLKKLFQDCNCFY